MGWLILQGHGNRCPQAGQFTHWRLEVSAPPRAEFAFFGPLVTRAR